MRIDYSHNLTINVLYPSLSIFLDIKMKTVSALLAYSTRLWFAIYLLASTLPRLITPARHFHSCNSCCHGREKLAIFMHPFPRVHFHEVWRCWQVTPWVTRLVVTRIRRFATLLCSAKAYIMYIEKRIPNIKYLHV